MIKVKVESVYKTTVIYIHFPCVSFPAPVNLAKTAPANNSVHAEVIHGELKFLNRKWFKYQHQTL